MHQMCNFKIINQIHRSLPSIHLALYWCCVTPQVIFYDSFLSDFSKIFCETFFQIFNVVKNHKSHKKMSHKKSFKGLKKCLAKNHLASLRSARKSQPPIHS